MNFEARVKGNARGRKPSGRRCPGAFVLLAICSFALNAVASDVILKNGARYSSVAILSRTGSQLTLQTQFGTMVVPLSEVSSIDGVPLVSAVPRAPVAAPPPAYLAPYPAAAGAVPGAGASAASATPPQAFAPPLPSMRRNYNDEDDSKPTPPPANSQKKLGLEAASSGPPYAHDLRMDFFLIACGMAAFGWLFTQTRVQKDLRTRSSKAIRWNLLPLFLPLIGFFLFSVWRSVVSIGERAKKRGASAVPIDPALDNKPQSADSHLKFVFESIQPEADKKDRDSEGTGVETARRLLEEAVAARTSDVHIEPQQDEYKVRFRIDGVLEGRAILSKLDGTRVVSALKALGQIDVAEKRKAQDGRFQTQIEGRDVDMRISTASSIFGEKMVVRILDTKGGIFGLAELGMSQEMIDQFNHCIHLRSGMILATGPTGAGKTSTLYAAISQLDRKRLNIMTIEDPVEYKLEGATQIPVNVNAGVTYESGLRSILRQDPDVILIGEMRDAEAGKIAMRAALTGALMFSSLHTKDTINTILRLAEMGIEPAQMGSALQMLIAQRLVRVLCTACREPYQSSSEDLYDIGIEMPAGETIYRAKGCDQCSNTGYRGRTGIFELFVFDDETRQAVARQASQEDILELARSKGFHGYREAGAHKILQGITTVQEVLQAG